MIGNQPGHYLRSVARAVRTRGSGCSDDPGSVPTSVAQTDTTPDNPKQTALTPMAHLPGEILPSDAGTEPPPADRPRPWLASAHAVRNRDFSPKGRGGSAF
jgi:hypothetical protein